MITEQSRGAEAELGGQDAIVKASLIARSNLGFESEFETLFCSSQDMEDPLRTAKESQDGAGDSLRGDTAVTSNDTIFAGCSDRPALCGEG